MPILLAEHHNSSRMVFSKETMDEVDNPGATEDLIFLETGERSPEMIKLVQCVRKQSEIEVLEFRRCWDEYRRMMEKAREQLGISRVLFSTALAVEDNFEVMLARGTRIFYDGIVELFLKMPRFFVRFLRTLTQRLSSVKYEPSRKNSWISALRPFSLP